MHSDGGRKVQSDNASAAPRIGSGFRRSRAPSPDVQPVTTHPRSPIQTTRTRDLILYEKHVARRMNVESIQDNWIYSYNIDISSGFKPVFINLAVSRT